MENNVFVFQSQILFLPLENKIHTLASPVSIFFSPHRMEFCTSPAQRSKKQKDVVPDSCYRRLKGILFFNRHTPVSNNKLKILLDERKDLSSALEDASTERRLPQEFRSWLEKCHRELDKEVGPKLVTQLCIFCWGFSSFTLWLLYLECYPNGAIKRTVCKNRGEMTRAN